MAALTQQQCVTACLQAFNNISFAQVNPQLSAQQINILKTSAADGVIIWPTTPVLSPYAVTHHGYSQIR